jgi:DNA-binding response OmpR family regulator
MRGDETMAKILHVENEPDTRELVKVILEGAGHVVTSAENGKECLSIYRKGKFDLVLLDIMMPDLSGWDVLQTLKKMDHSAKVAFLSVLEVSDERKERLKEEGLADYIMKPFTSKELKTKVNAILKNK